jgi:hypothetical protein
MRRKKWTYPLVSSNFMKTVSIIILTLTFLTCTNKDNNNMGLFDKLFGKKETPKQTENKSMNFDTTQLTKTAEMLEEDLYWTIIDNSLKNTSNQDDQEHYLIKEIGNLTPKQMVGFRLRTDKLLHDTYNSELWCAGYIMNGGCSDDGFEYFRNWIISRGKETYYSAKQNPDNLIKEVNEHSDIYDFESFWYVALEAFKGKTGKDLYDYIDDENFHTKEGQYPQIEFNWEEELLLTWVWQKWGFSTRLNICTFYELLY